MPHAGDIWLTRRKSMPTMMLASQCRCGLPFVFENLRREHREFSWPSVRLSYSPTASSIDRRTPFADVAAKSGETGSKRFSGALACGLRHGRSATGPGL